MTTDLTVTWKNAVPFDAVWGQQVSEAGRGVVFDAAAMAAGFDIQPFHDSSAESAMKGAVPFATDEDFSWTDEYHAAVEQVQPKRGRPRKEV